LAIRTSWLVAVAATKAFTYEIDQFVTLYLEDRGSSMYRSKRIVNWLDYKQLANPDSTGSKECWVKTFISVPLGVGQ
jgi:hypothetical protein